jgi:hypothetical protein
MQSEFESRSYADDAPEGICAQCAAGGLHHAPTGTDITYCGHHLRGAFRVRSHPWKVIPGIEYPIFRETMVRGLTVAELHADLESDLQRLLKKQAAESTLH